MDDAAGSVADRQQLIAQQKAVPAAEQLQVSSSRRGRSLNVLVEARSASGFALYAKQDAEGLGPLMSSSRAEHR
jgi:hypothetical protein